jgi:hypothetical protein
MEKVVLFIKTFTTICHLNFFELRKIIFESNQVWTSLKWSGIRLKSFKSNWRPLGAVAGAHLSTSLTAVWAHKPAVQCMSSSVIFFYLPAFTSPVCASSGTVLGPPYAYHAARSGHPQAPPLSPWAPASSLVRSPSRQALDCCTSTWGSPVALVLSFAAPSTPWAALLSSAHCLRLSAGVPELHWSERAVWSSPHQASRSRRRSAAHRSLLTVLSVPLQAAAAPPWSSAAVAELCLAASFPRYHSWSTERWSRRLFPRWQPRALCPPKLSSVTSAQCLRTARAELLHVGSIRPPMRPPPLLFLSLSQQRLSSSECNAGHDEPVLQRCEEKEERSWCS